MHALIHFFKSSVFIVLVLAYASLTHASSQPYLWQVQHQGAKVYLLGSIHALTADYYPLPKVYTQAFAQADRLAVELDPSALDGQRSARLIQSKMWLPQGNTLEPYLSDDELKQLKLYASQSGADYERALRLRPWMLAEQLTQYQLQQADYDAKYGVDLYFLKQAKARQLPILELETLAQQINAIAEAPFRAQLAMLKSGLAQMNDADYMAQMTQYWRQGDADGLYQFVYQDVLDNPDLKPLLESLLDRRNRHMADVISIYLNQSPTRQVTTFVVVGALHLSGPNSLLVELKRKGYYVTRVSQEQTETRP